MSSLAIATCFMVFALAVLTGFFAALKKTSKERETLPVYKKPVCFEGVGCFDNDKPWTGPLRPVPPPESPDHIPTSVLFYSRQNRDESNRIDLHPVIRLGNLSFDGSRSTLLLIHGFMRNSASAWMHSMKDEYLELIDANVMLTDWKSGDFHTYPQTVSNTRVVGRLLTKLMTHLIQERYLKPASIHLVGHSLGAHICSYIAKAIPGIGRLTALDPAQPGFEGLDAKVRLDKSDAVFVEVVHTDPKPFIPMMGFGMMTPHGHVDFYFNSGANQPGCLVPDGLTEVKTMEDLKKLPMEYPYKVLGCSHERAYEYLVEAYNQSNHCIFWGHKLLPSDVVRFIKSDFTGGDFSDFNHHTDICTVKECIPFGLHAIQSPLRGVFLVKTDFVSPYCLPSPWKYSDGLQETIIEKRQESEMNVQSE